MPKLRLHSLLILKIIRVLTHQENYGTLEDVLPFICEHGTSVFLQYSSISHPTIEELMKLYSWNVNGIRAAEKKGFLDWLEETQPDILCLQETKANVDQLGSSLIRDHGYHTYWHSAEKKGYSGVATFKVASSLRNMIIFYSIIFISPTDRRMIFVSNTSSIFMMNYSLSLMNR